jgi:large subunit ribosomal protein L44e
MNIPKTQRRYCPFCRKHTMHSIRRISVGKKRRKMAQGERRVDRKKLGFGSFPKSNPKGRAKPTRKLDLRYKCNECKKEHTIGQGFRVKKFELKKRL